MWLGEKLLHANFVQAEVYYVPFVHTVQHWFYYSDVFMGGIMIFLEMATFQQIKWDNEGNIEIVIYTSTSGIQYFCLHELFTKVCDMYVNSTVQ